VSAVAFLLYITNTYTSFKQFFQDDESLSINFVKLVLTAFIEVYLTSTIYWQSNRIYLHCIPTLQMNEML